MFRILGYIIFGLLHISYALYLSTRALAASIARLASDEAEPTEEVLLSIAAAAPALPVSKAAPQLAASYNPFSGFDSPIARRPTHIALVVAPPRPRWRARALVALRDHLFPSRAAAHDSQHEHDGRRETLERVRKLSERDEQRALECALESTKRVCRWAALAGVRQVSAYDPQGILKKHADELQQHVRAFGAEASPSESSPKSQASQNSSSEAQQHQDSHQKSQNAREQANGELKSSWAPPVRESSPLQRHAELSTPLYRIRVEVHVPGRAYSEFDSCNAATLTMDLPTTANGVSPVSLPTPAELSARALRKRRKLGLAESAPFNNDDEVNAGDKVAFERSSHPSEKDLLASANSVKEMCNGSGNSEIEELSVRLNLIGPDDSRPTFARAAERIAQRMWEKSGGERQQDWGKAFKEIDAEMVERELQALDSISEPDLLIIHGGPAQRQILHGFPAWQLRLSEIFYDRHTDPRRPINLETFIAALRQYGHCQVRLGR